ncbi:MAG: hypothetical protein JO345_05215 [Streptosporangiaceae bacterium]|nr:hypothetical protein [Streptosporangiaceae bacterium]
MAELDELRTEVSGLRELVRMADSDMMDTRILLKHQTHLMVALREVQNTANVTFGEQGQILGGMVVAINELQIRVSTLDKRVLDLTFKFDREIAGVKAEVAGLKAEVAGLGENITAIMRHLGI